MLRDSEPSGRWPDDAWALITKSDVVSGASPGGGNWSSVVADSEAETAQRVADDASIVPEIPHSRLAAGTTQVTMFLAGVGVVTVGKYALIALFAAGGANRPELARTSLPAAQPAMSEASPGLPGLIDVEDIEVIVKRFAFTSGGAFSEAAQSQSQAEVVLANP